MAVLVPPLSLFPFGFMNLKEVRDCTTVARFVPSESDLNSKDMNSHGFQGSGAGCHATLAQAVVDGDRKRDALPRGTIERERAVDDVTAASSAFVWAMARMDAEDILAALDAERAQGYARAMGEVVEWCKTEARDEWRTWPRGPEYKSALADVARWAAAAEKEHEK